MKTFTNLFILSAMILTFVVMTTSVKAEIITAPPEIYFNLTNAKDKSQDHKDLWGGFEFVISKADTGASLTMKLTPEGVAKGYGTGDDGIKFKDFDIKLAGLNNIFTSTNYIWSNNGWTGADNQGTSVALTFKNGMDWEQFVALAEDMIIKAHIQSINANGNAGYSLNDAEFTYYGVNEPGHVFPEVPGAATPEPATMLILGLGLAGLGLARRRQMVK